MGNKFRFRTLADYVNFFRVFAPNTAEGIFKRRGPGNVVQS